MWAQKAAAIDTLMAMPLWIVLILPIAKIVATSLSIGTGGSGGRGYVAGRSAGPSALAGNRPATSRQLSPASTA